MEEREFPAEPNSPRVQTADALHHLEDIPEFARPYFARQLAIELAVLQAGEKIASFVQRLKAGKQRLAIWKDIDAKTKE